MTPGNSYDRLTFRLGAEMSGGEAGLVLEMCQFQQNLVLRDERVML